jgi:DNA-binding NarL/FixJ family response regulator
MSVRCLLADDHPALLATVAELLRRSDFEIVGPAADGARAVAAAAAELPELALVDYRMPRLAGAELIKKLLEVSPKTAIVVYTAEADERVVAAALGAGASGVVLKEAPLPDVVRALEAALAGDIYIDPGLAPEALTGMGRAPELRPRELAILSLLAEGLTHEVIGQRLSIGSETVRSHLRKACKRLDASTRTEAVATALRLGLID